MEGGTQTPDFLALNPAGQVPTVQFADGRTLAQSNAVILHLADGSRLLPTDPYECAKVHEYLFWEQYSHEPYIAVCRFQMVYLGRGRDDLDPEKVERGYKALDVMETRLGDRDYFVSDRLTLADIGLTAYSRVAHEGGFDLGSYPNIRRWIANVDTDLVEV